MFDNAWWWLVTVDLWLMLANGGSCLLTTEDHYGNPGDHQNPKSQPHATTHPISTMCCHTILFYKWCLMMVNTMEYIMEYQRITTGQTILQYQGLCVRSSNRQRRFAVSCLLVGLDHVVGTHSSKQSPLTSTIPNGISTYHGGCPLWLLLGQEGIEVWNHKKQGYDSHFIEVKVSNNPSAKWSLQNHKFWSDHHL